MSNFQHTVGLYQAAGIPGSIASTADLVSLAKGRIAAVDLPFGHFCWLGQDSNTVTNVGADGVKPLGYVIHTKESQIYNVKDEVTGSYPAGMNVEVIVQGHMYGAAPTAAKAGQKVFANIADGSIAVGDAGATVAGAVETDFFVETDAEANEAFIMTNFGPVPKAATAPAPPAGGDNTNSDNSKTGK